MTDDNPSIPVRLCKQCGLVLARTPEFWHKDPKAKDGLCYTCKECAKARSRKYGVDHREEVLENHHIYYLEHKDERQAYIAENADHIAETKREWRKANPEKVRKHKSDSQKRNRFSANVRGRRWRERNPDKARVASHNAYIKNPDRFRHNVLNRIARMKQAEGTYTIQDIRDLYEMQCGLCAYCGIRLFDDYHVDHMQPLSRNGTNWPDNLALTCEHCNLTKNSKMVTEWALVRGW